LRWKAGRRRLQDRRQSPSSIPTHLDASTHVYDRYYIAKGDNIIDAWPIMGKAGAASR
jgi:D-serine deaminase-like pyridoxal phosphate-dependent protein